MVLYDVVVCGCGSAGFCAAIAAARNGSKVAVIEKYACPGGVLTVLGNNSIDQFNNPFRKEKKMVITGIGWEFAKKIAAAGFAYIPDMDAPYEKHWQYGVKVNPVAAAKIMDDMLVDAGVDIYYGQQVIAVETEQNKIIAVQISTKSGIRCIPGKVFVDCTGDGDIAAWAGADFEAGDGKGNFQPGTIRYYPIIEPASGDFVVNFGDNTNHINQIDTTNSDKMTWAEIKARQLLFNKMLEGKQNGQRIIASAPAVAPREGRRIIGNSYMRIEDYVSGKVFEDSICYSFWFVDIHRENAPAYIQYISDGSTPTIRLSAMEVKGFCNLFTAGRCVSSDRETNSALRVKASCMAMGQAVGVAASELAHCNIVDVANLSVENVKHLLHKQGAVVPNFNSPVDYLSCK